MALPSARLSSAPVVSAFSGARALAITKTVDYEDGGVAIRDVSKGRIYQRWRGRLVSGRIAIDAPNTPPFVALERPGISEFSFTFDQNMRLCIAFVENNAAKLLWFDSQAQASVITNLGADVKTPRVALDDKRGTQDSASDIVLGYVREGRLCYRQQRDRFEIERVLDIGPHVGLIKIGMTAQLRLQFLLEVPS